MRLLRSLFTSPFGRAVLGCLILAGWASFSAGILDGPVARDLRTSAVYAAPGVELDEAAAERIIGNRRVTVAFLEPGADLRSGCDGVRRAADGTVALMISRNGAEFDTYGCALLPGADDENFGRAAVAETVIGSGIDPFVDQPLEAMKLIAINYDGLVKAGTVPDGARTISPSLPRYLIAGAALLAVVAGSSLMYVTAYRAGRSTAVRRAERDTLDDARIELSAAAGVLAQQIIALDGKYSLVTTRTGRRGARMSRRTAAVRREFAQRYRQVASDYTELLGEITKTDAGSGQDVGSLTARVEALSARCRALGRLRLGAG
ncbi:hypothetical protein FHR81_004461 [Actinoalloteichus hoggarensis]|uniref:Uncharacterized protein n=1 Tax=Actinoalloteichus hoggarensis TaxID=1470176 RepID=A0A221W3C5_9PSEU|nr:hypothetical protein [Actinoalloteichus hoggarensis]ASO20352.1 hypothetical protein AHOG_13545 [Actinoalloteichus hoggarensis]MBB5923390.1 hypothetical protein [Actinoalloteichus hoggarensis]